jgi:spoIIIJ-associated protein
MSTAELSGGERLREFLEHIVEALDLEARIEVEDDGETLTGRLEGDDLGLFIGRHGQTIDAVQHLALRVAGGRDDDRRRVVVDAAGYRVRRERAICDAADRAADEALRYSRPVSMDAMSAIERRVAHEYLRDRAGVETYSEGDEPERRLVVAPVT